MLAACPCVLCCLEFEDSPRPKEGPKKAQHVRGRPVRDSMVVRWNGSPAHHIVSVSAEQHGCRDGVKCSVLCIAPFKWRILYLLHRRRHDD